MRRSLFTSALVAVLGFSSSLGLADSIKYMGQISFQSDLQAPANVDLPSFDTQGGALTLISVQVETFHSGAAEPAGDNDDPFQGARASARIIRSWTSTGPGVFAFGNRTVNSPFVDLTADNGDLAAFDATPPDGVDFGVLGYGPELANTTNPAPGLYATPGPGTVSFTVTPTLMVNDTQFEDPPGTPDSWQLEVENPDLTVKVSVTYTWIPEPATLSLLALGALALRRR
ncbi:hypothetical protein RAS1_40340 [Phycisphaerae bacterium RAS1]|nr:hypothetical protein RAS1_40340 [Phycisphaerae bacterium RAS1]